MSEDVKPADISYNNGCNFSSIGSFNADNAERQLVEKIESFKEGMKQMEEAREYHRKMKELEEQQKIIIDAGD